MTRTEPPAKPEALMLLGVPVAPGCVDDACLVPASQEASRRHGRLLEHDEG